MSKIIYADKVALNSNSGIADINKCNATDMNEIKSVVNENDDRLTTVETGWVSSNETWEYSSVDDPTGIIAISGDVTTKYSLGMRIKFTNGGNVIYGIITAISLTGSITILEFLHEIDPTDNLALHLMASGAITNNYYSSMKVPYGFPTDPSKWSLVFADTENRQQDAPAKSTVYNLGNSSLTLPIGNWNVNYGVLVYIVRSSSGATEATVSLSKSNSTFTDIDFSYTVFNSPASSYMVVATKNKILNIIIPTTYYLLMSTSNQMGVTFFQFRGGFSTTKITATCTYL